FESNDAIDVVGPAGDDDDADLGLRPHFAGQRQTVLIRQPEVKEDEIHRGRGEALAQLCTAPGETYPVALTFEVAREHGAYALVVIDDEKVGPLRTISHFRQPCCRAAIWRCRRKYAKPLLQINMKRRRFKTSMPDDDLHRVSSHICDWDGNGTGPLE